MSDNPVSLVDFGDDLQLGSHKQSGRQSYDAGFEIAHPLSTNNPTEARVQGLVDEASRPKPSGASTKRKTRESTVNDTDSIDEESANNIKRQRNTMAARRYRQKGRDRIAELEAALRAVEEERDLFRLQLARKEAEVDALKEILKK